MSVLLITHDLGVVNEIADRVVVMYAGEVVESGPARQSSTRPRHPYSQGLLRSMPALAPGGAAAARDRRPRAQPGQRPARLPVCAPLPQPRASMRRDPPELELTDG